MEILVNREPLDFKLENESSIGEVVDGLADWLNASRFAITALDVDATSYAIHDRQSWQDIRVDEVDQLSVEALPLNDVDHATLVALDEYFSILAECLETGNEEPLAEIARELPFVRKRIAQFFPSLAPSGESASIVANAALEDGRMPSGEALTDLLQEITSIRTILQSRQQEYRDPARELALTLGQLSATASRLVEVPVQLQTGHENTAMQTVIALTELLARVVRLIPLVEAADDAGGIDIPGTRRFAEELAPYLSELKEAFEIQDTVLIGDLLEYEVAPRLGELRDLLPEEAEER